MNGSEPEPEREQSSDQERELEAFLELSRRGRAKLERLHEVLTTPGHYGTGATPTVVVYRENKLRLLRLLDETGQPRVGRPPVLFVPAPVSRYFILDLLPGRSFAGHVAAAGFDVYIADFGTPSRDDRFADLAYYVEGLVRRCVRTVSALTGAAAIDIVGYCLGGTLSLLYAALHPETVRRLVLLTTTVDGDVEGGIPVGGTPHGARRRKLRQPPARAGVRGKELVRDARPGLEQRHGPRQRSLGSARRRARAPARGAHDVELGRRRGAGAGPAAGRALS